MDLNAYTQLSGKHKKVNYSAGVRMESTNVKSNYTDNSSSSAVNKRSTQFFPKASVTLPVDSSKTLTLRYSKTITRPDYSNANQTAVYINPYFEWANNININPYINQEVSVTFQYKDYSLALSVYQAKGPVYSKQTYCAGQRSTTTAKPEHPRCLLFHSNMAYGARPMS
jgi:hypothetical protein